MSAGIIALATVAHVPTLSRAEITPDFQQTLVAGARKLGEAKVEWIYPVYDCTKAQIAEMLPPELAALTWSCRRPVARGAGWVPCGACKACLARGEVSLQNPA